MLHRFFVLQTIRVYVSSPSADKLQLKAGRTMVACAHSEPYLKRGIMCERKWR